MKRKIHKGDTVKVITGSDKGIIGEVLEVFPAEGKIRVEGVRSQKRHQAGAPCCTRMVVSWRSWVRSTSPM